MPSVSSVFISVIGNLAIVICHYTIFHAMSCKGKRFKMIKIGGMELLRKSVINMLENECLVIWRRVCIGLDVNSILHKDMLRNLWRKIFSRWAAFMAGKWKWKWKNCNIVKCHPMWPFAWCKGLKLPATA